VYFTSVVRSHTVVCFCSPVALCMTASIAAVGIVATLFRENPETRTSRSGNFETIGEKAEKSGWGGRRVAGFTPRGKFVFSLQLIISPLGHWLLFRAQFARSNFDRSFPYCDVEYLPGKVTEFVQSGNWLP